MKGLYVYGSLTMVLSFIIGAQTGNGALTAVAIAAALSAAATEACAEVFDATGGEWILRPGLFLALLSWALTAAAAVYAILILL